MPRQIANVFPISGEGLALGRVPKPESDLMAPGGDDIGDDGAEISGADDRDFDSLIAH
jgi:hypothetical protein